MKAIEIKKIMFFLIFLCLWFPLSSLAEDILKEGEKFIKSGEYLKCRDYYKKFMEYPNIADGALLNTGKCEYFLNNYPEATLYLRRLLRDFKDSPYVNEGSLYLGLSYLKMGKIKDAEYYLKKVTPPFEKEAQIGLGWISYEKGDMKAVESLLNRLNYVDFKENIDAHLLKIKYLASTGKLEEALKEFEKNPKLKGKNFLIERAELLIRAKKFQEAEKILSKIIAQDDKLLNKIKAKNMLFDLHLQQGKVEEAIKIGKEIYLYVPTDEFKIKLLSAYLTQKNYDEALKLLVTFRDPQIKMKKMEETIKILESENPQKAAEYIVKLYPFFSSDASVLIYYGEFLINQGKIIEAKNVLKKVLSGPRKGEALIPYAKILIFEGKLSEAKKMLEGIKEKKPQAAGLYAQILYKEGDLKNALNYMRKAIKNIDDPQMILIAGDLEYSVGDKKAALRLWTKSGELGNAEALLKVADFYYLSKKIEEASKFYKKAIELGNLHNKSLLWAYYQYGKINKDKSYLEKVANSGGELAKAAQELLEKL